MIVAAVQVRFASTRLPGKALAEVLDHPMLWHIVRRVKSAQSIDQVVIATSEETADAPIRNFANLHNIPCFAGSELDLIDRLYKTARLFGADAIVRVTGDCPLADPGVIDKLVSAYLTKPDDVAYITNTLPPTYPDGLDLEVYPIETLERLTKEIQVPFWREWFPSYLMEHQESFHALNVSYPADLSSLRWTVDYEEDLSFVREVYRQLHQESNVFVMGDVLELLQRQPQLGIINAKYTRNEGYARAIEAYKGMEE